MEKPGKEQRPSPRSSESHPLMEGAIVRRDGSKIMFESEILP
jgi:hypothetical protein